MDRFGSTVTGCLPAWLVVLLYQVCFGFDIDLGLWLVWFWRLTLGSMQWKPVGDGFTFGRWTVKGLGSR